MAINAVMNTGGRLVLPHQNCLSECGRDGFGTVPNRLAADFSDVATAKEAAVAAVKAVHTEWKKVADAVWEEFVVGVSGGNGTDVIWNRQVENFWEVTWVVAAPEKSDSQLAARKNWRTTSATIEGGDHCTMMSDRQELSGWIRSKRKDDQDRFWELLRSQRDIGQLDLDKDERLCAIALIKRLFPRVAKKAIERDLEANRWPSTAYVAAIPWLRAVGNNPETQAAARDYAVSVRKLAGNSLGERMTKIESLERIKILPGNPTGDFLKLDGNFFQRAAIDNDKVTPFEPKLDDADDADDADDEQQRRNLQKALKELSDRADEKPSAFYALLLMDGDSMGALLSEARHLDNEQGEQTATAALGRFSMQVPSTVGKHDGVTIYAGGDDVLAMLPVPDALQCAMALEKSYRDAFQKAFPESSGKRLVSGATLSGAIVYAHYHTPLRDVLRTAHRLLDDVAKDATGRDSLAVAVYKSSGITAQWAAPWTHIRDVGEGAKADNIIDALVADLGVQHSVSRAESASVPDSDSRHGVTGARSAEFSSGFLYNVRERFAALTDKPLTKPGEFVRLSPELVVEQPDTKTDNEKSDGLLRSVLVADLMRGKQNQDDEINRRHLSETERLEARRRQAEKAVDRLLKLSQRVTRSKYQYDTLGIDGALVVRFLACDGKEDSE
jgi:CRISPR-associated protein Cmr2